MVVIVVIALVLLSTACANVLMSRRSNDDALVRHERALAALRELAAHPRPVAADLRSEPEPPTDHVRILSEPPAGAVPHRRRTTRTGTAAARTGARRRPVAPVPSATRPRIAVPAKTFDATTDAHDPEPAPIPAPASPDPVSVLPVPAPAAPRKWPALVAVAAAVALVATASTIALTPAHKTSRNARSTQPVVATTTPAPALRVVPTTVAAPSAETVRFAASPTGDGVVTVRVPFTLTLEPTGPCWVRVENDAGQTLFEGTLHAGQHQPVTGSGPLTIRLGNTPAMQMLVNGAQVDLAGAARTANVKFLPPA